MNDADVEFEISKIAGIEAWGLGWREEKHVFGDQLKVPGKGRAVSEK